MTEKISLLYKNIKDNLTIDHLKTITIDIINCYKNRNFTLLRRYIPVLKLSYSVKNNKLFSILIRTYHPDKLSFLLRQAEIFYNNSDHVKLAEFHDCYFFKLKPAAKEFDDFRFTPEYEYDFDPGSFSIKDIMEEDDNFGETNLEYPDEEYSFMDAMKIFYFEGLDPGNEEFRASLRNMEGNIDLSDMDLYDLNGIEHCIYIDEINLSNNGIEKIGRLSRLLNLKSLFLTNNEIESIDALGSLRNLKELDISFNNISKIGVLEDLDRLEYVNLIGNPVNDYDVLKRLIKKGVTVIFDNKVIE